MRIADICTRNVVCIGAAASVRDAAEVMHRREVGSLIVTDPSDEDRVPQGILTDRDVALSIATGERPEERSVGETMTRSLVTCTEGDDLYDVLRRMRGNRVRRMPVVDAEGRLAGIVTADDIVGALSAHLFELAPSEARERIVNDPRR